MHISDTCDYVSVEGIVRSDAFNFMLERDELMPLSFLGELIEAAEELI